MAIKEYPLQSAPGTSLTVQRAARADLDTAILEDERLDLAEIQAELIELRAQVADGNASSRYGEKGGVGTMYFAGIVSGEEYVAELQGDRAIKTYDKMWRSDGQVAAVIRVCELPLLEAEWTIKAASDDPLDIEVAQFVQDNLLNGLSMTWQATLEHILTFYRYGFSVFEKVWTLGDDGKIRLKKLAPRLAKTIVRIFPNQFDEVDHIEQQVWKVKDQSGLGTFETVEIPGDKVVIFTLKREGNNFQGVSLLRHGYKHWYYKQNMEAIDAIAIERNAMGVPWIKTPTGAQNSDRTIAARSLANLHAHEKMYMVVPDGNEFGIAGTTGQLRDPIRSMEYHSLQLSRSVLAQFLDLDKGGSYALSEDQSTFFLQNLKAVSKIVIGPINKDVIRPLVDFNYAVERYPTLEMAPLDKRNFEKIAAAIATLFSAGVLTYTPETENAVRSWGDLPDLPAEAVLPDENAATVDTDSMGKEAETPIEQTQKLSVDLVQYWRPLRPSEKLMNLDALEKSFDTDRERVLASIAAIIAEQAVAVLAVAKRKVEQGKPLNPDQIDIPKRAEMAAALDTAMTAIFMDARHQLRQDLIVQGVTPDDYSDEPDADATSYISAKAIALAGMLALAMRAALTYNANRQTGGEFDAVTLQQAITENMARSARSVAVSAAGDAIARGRDAEAKAIAKSVATKAAKAKQTIAPGGGKGGTGIGGLITDAFGNPVDLQLTATYSAVLDRHTCEPCRDADGRIVDVASDEYRRLIPPYRDCEGGEACRCFFDYSFTPVGSTEE